MGSEEFRAVPGQPEGEGSLVAWAALERAAALCISGEYSERRHGPGQQGAPGRDRLGLPGTDRVLRRPVGRGADDGLLRREAARGARHLAHPRFGRSRST